MSDAMMFGIAKMPYEMAMRDELSRRQFYANTQRLVAALEAAQEDACMLRGTLRTVSAVGIVQLFGTARDDVLAEFSLEELQEICRVTERLRPVYVERIYRAAWDAAIDQARGKGVAE